MDSVRECFLALGCGSGKFGAAEAAAARDLQRRGIPLAVIEDAMLMGACRKYISWFEGRALEPIRSLAYFEPLIAEIQEKPLTCRLFRVPSKEGQGACQEPGTRR